jgi:prevent-host-death family protein
MANLKVSLHNIIPLTEARDHFSQIVNEVQRDKLYVLTKGGKPVVAIIDVKYLETVSGGSINAGQVEEEIQKDPVKVGRTPMIKLNSTPFQPSGNPINPKPYSPNPIANPASDSSSQPKPIVPEVNSPFKPIFGQNPNNSSSTDLKTPMDNNLGAKPVAPNQTPSNGPLKINFQPVAKPAVSSANMSDAPKPNPTPTTPQNNNSPFNQPKPSYTPSIPSTPTSANNSSNPISTPSNPVSSPSTSSQLDKPLPKPLDSTPVTPTIVNPSSPTPSNNSAIPKPVTPNTPLNQPPTPSATAAPSAVPTFGGIPTPVVPKPIMPSTPSNPEPSAASTSINPTPVTPNNYPKPVSTPTATPPSNSPFTQPSKASTPAPQDSISVSNTSPLSDLPPRPVTSPITGPLSQSAPMPTPTTDAKPLVMPSGLGLNNAATIPDNSSGNSINVIPSFNNSGTPKPNPAPLNSGSADDVDDMALD